MTEKLGAKSFVRLEFSRVIFSQICGNQGKENLFWWDRSVDEELVNKMDYGKNWINNLAPNLKFFIV